MIKYCLISMVLGVRLPWQCSEIALATSMFAFEDRIRGLAFASHMLGSVSHLSFMGCGTEHVVKILGASILQVI